MVTEFSYAINIYSYINYICICIVPLNMTSGAASVNWYEL